MPVLPERLVEEGPKIITCSNVALNEVAKLDANNVEEIVLRKTIDRKGLQSSWGRRGSSSEVAKLKYFGNYASIENDKPYAELWMGTHPSGPAKIIMNDSEDPQYLSDYLKLNESSVGQVPPGYLHNDLPFMFKVLSIQTALSIQAHPDKTLAHELHTNFPAIYRDNNHKPEMAIALTPFEALCGFRSVENMKQHLIEYPELRCIIEYDSISIDCDDAVITKKIFENFMRCPDDICNGHLNSLITRLGATTSVSELDHLLLRLWTDFPGDRGTLCPLLFNYIKLDVGEGFFMGANIPHAYISGDCLECMALSDNVVRAGLTPKFKDVETLLRMLDYTSGNPSLLSISILDQHTLLYRPDCKLCAEFEVEFTSLPATTAEYSYPAIPCASILLALRVPTNHGYISVNNEKSSIKQGDVVYIETDATVILQVSNNTVESSTFYRAHVNLG